MMSLTRFKREGEKTREREKKIKERVIFFVSFFSLSLVFFFQITNNIARDNVQSIDFTHLNIFFRFIELDFLES